MTPDTDLKRRIEALIHGYDDGEFMDAPACADAIAALIADARARAFEEVADECRSLRSRADHAKKHAMMDNHTSEICHQEGRWHAANDLEDWAAAAIRALAKKETPDGE